MKGPAKYENTRPNVLQATAMPVAIPRSEGGNQVFASREGAEIATGPPRALVMYEAWRRAMEEGAVERAKRRRVQPHMLHIEPNRTERRKPLGRSNTYATGSDARRNTMDP